jgi:hypothetical protein
VNHSAHGVFPTDLTLLLQSLLKCLYTAVQEMFLIIVLLLDVSIHVYFLDILLLNIFIQTIVNCKLELTKVVDILDYPVDSCLEALDVVLVVPDLLSALAVELLDLLLLISELIHYKTKLQVDCVIPSQRSVHLVIAHFQIHNFLLSGGDITLQLLDFEV